MSDAILAWVHENRPLLVVIGIVAAVAGHALIGHVLVQCDREVWR